MELINILLGGGILAFIQWAVDKLSLWHTKNDKTVKAIEGLSEKVEALKDTMDERDAVLARTHILRFNDEIYNGVKHSKEYFEQILEDIKTYENLALIAFTPKLSRTTAIISPYSCTISKAPI